LGKILFDKAMSERTKPTLTSDFFAENAKDIEKVLRCAANHALLVHKRLGNPIATWIDGKVVIIPPEEIVVLAEPLRIED
jgi:hypothetical protein